MKRKKFCVFLGFEAVICILLQFVDDILPGVFTAAMVFPFEQIGLGLRILSLSGDMGNILSIVLYSFICLMPVAVLLLIKRKRRMYPEDTLLAILSMVLFAVVYLMVNPGLINPYFDNNMIRSVGKAALGGIVYSVIVGYVILRILRRFFHADVAGLQKYLSMLLYVLNVLFICLAFGVCFGSLLNSFDALRSGNTGNEHNLGISYLFLILQYVVEALPYILDVLVVFAALNLLDELKVDRYSQETVVAAGKLSRLCGTALAITVISNLVYNILQLAFIRTLFTIKGSVKIPLPSIIFVLAALILAQYIREDKQLKDDNDMFI